ncbi:MAG: hypothetical protein Q8M22_01645, partial [Actinomycetota bacterium]|nr:hypothetical protein [Actinomycetota bacterium]
MPVEPIEPAAATDAPDESHRSPRTGMAPAWFVLGVVLVVWGGVIVLDAIGPTFDREARITGTDTGRDRRGVSTYTLEGIDDHGGTFETTVDAGVHDDASRGDRVVVSRSYVTGRVVNIVGPGFSQGGLSSVPRYFLAMAAVGAGLMVWSVRAMRRRPAGAPLGERVAVPTSLRWWTLAVVASVVVWAVYERSVAEVRAGKSAAPVTTEATPEPVPQGAPCASVAVDGPLVETA